MGEVTREEAVYVLFDMLAGIVNELKMSQGASSVWKSMDTLQREKPALELAIKALQPWERAEERPPDEEDADETGEVLAFNGTCYRSVGWKIVRKYPREFPWWSRIPALPEHIVEANKKEGL